MASPELNVQVTADISALQAGMQSAVSSVDSATANIRTAVQSVAPALDAVGKASQDLGKNVAGTLMDAAKQAQAAADELKRLAAVQFGDQTQDLKLQLDILRATDPVVKAQLEGRRQLAAIRREARDIDAKGADAAAREMIATKELLAIEQMRQNVQAVRSRIVENEIRQEAARLAAAQASRAAEQQQLAAMQQAVQANNAAIVSLGQRYDTFMREGAAGARRVNVAMQGMNAAAIAATGDIEGAMMALPTIFGQVAGAAFSLGGVLHETFTGAKAAAAQLEEEVRKLEQSSGVKAQTREYERLLAIEKELDPIRKLELERQNAIARARREMLEMTKEIGGAEAAAMQAARERLINAQYDNKIREANERLAKQTAEADERSTKAKEEIAKIEPPKQTPMQALVSSVTTSLGGAFNFAQNPVLQSIQDYAIKQAGYQANLVLTAREILQLLRNQGTVIT